MNNKLGNCIKEKREKLEISQRELARRINVDNATISKIENGNIEKPTFEVLAKLSKELDIPLYKLMEYSNYEELEQIFYSASYNNACYFVAMNEIEEDIINSVISSRNKEIFIDIRKILYEYKKGNISDEIAVKLIAACTPIDIDDELIYRSEKDDIVINIEGM